MWYALCTPKKKEKEGLQKREMLTDALRVMVNNLFKKIFYEKRKKKQLMSWQLFLFSIKVISKLS